ncbi:Cytochrome P450 family protein [Ceratobasidium theobromae]|uniref:Cytochrome P450 family protein n=1 Tax=Ceratobasidium theobromae TaxID=1582974 RepID=A0A5N5QCY2_9AGAM|nr:Cytochrome P450 family protein [Ceratobasidium theobromae]
MTIPIPHPRNFPVIGSLPSIDAKLPSDSLLLLAKKYGEIYSFKIPGETVVCVSTVKLAQEVLDEKRFHKGFERTLGELRNLSGDGLITAHHGEPVWGIAHRILMPAFGPLSIKNMFDDMVDVASQLVLKWERFGPKHEIDPTDDFTRLTLETIALCTFNYRLNTFYMENPPFTKALMDWLHACVQRVRRPEFINAFTFRANAKYAADMKIMNDVASQIVQDRKKNPIEKNDLLNIMLNGKDPQTGQKLSDSNIQAQMITFLAAGHDTTSGLLSFVMAHALKYPNVYTRIKQEVDTVLGKEPLKYEHLSKLTYINAVLRETLRVTPSLSEFLVTCDKDEIIGDGKYLIKKGTIIALLIRAVGKDPAVWGDDAESFNPDRMLDGKFEALPPKAWIPFGSGARACIGRVFAFQEALIALATIFQKCDFVPADPSYTLQLQQSLTLKPQKFKFRAIPRKDAPSFSVIAAPAAPHVEAEKVKHTATNGTEQEIPLYVLYGSNSGSCQGFAQTIASKAAGKGFHAKIDTLDSVAHNIPKDGPVVIVTASFEGEPADNAGHFVQSLTTTVDIKNLGEVSFAVFGAGNHDWAQSYQRIPRLIDDILEKKGAKRLLEHGEGDAGGDSFIESFNEWEETLWETLEYHIEIKGESNAPSVSVKLVGAPTDRATALRQPDSKLGLVVENRLLTAVGAPAKHHIEFELPEGMSYQTGDYVAMYVSLPKYFNVALTRRSAEFSLPTNPPEYVRRVLARFKVSPEQHVILDATGPTTLPTGKPVNISEILYGFVEIGQSVTKRNISTLLDHAKDPFTRAGLEALLATYNLKEGKPHSSLLDLLEKYPDIDLSLGDFIAALPSMRLRQYSISSSPLSDSSRVTLTFGVVTHGHFLGVASNYLANLRKGDRVQMAVRPSPKAFHPPSDPSVPMVLFAAGSGMAPFRGFLQERALQAQAGRQVGKSLLFFGCRKPDEDYLYGDKELAEWEAQGVVDVRAAFSRAPDKSRGQKYVQHLVWADRNDVRAYFEKDAKFYTCGGSQVATGIRETFIRIIAEHINGDEAQATELFKKIQSERYATDVFG